MCLLSRYRWNLLDRRVCYLRLVKVFNTNAVHDSSKSPGSLRLLEDRRNGFYRALKFFLDDSFAEVLKVTYLLLCSDELVLLQLSVC